MMNVEYWLYKQYTYCDNFNYYTIVNERAHNLARNNNKQLK